MQARYHSFKLTEDNIERQFAINHLAPFLLSLLLLERLKKSKDGRIITVSSHSQYGATLDFSDLYMEDDYFSFRMYKRTKLCNVLFTKKLANILDGEQLTANCLHPGIVETHIGGRHAGIFIKWAWRIIKYFKKAIPVEEGAATSIFLASSEEVKNISGEYFYKCKTIEPDSLAKDEDLAEKLWEISLQLCNLKSS